MEPEAADFIVSGGAKRASDRASASSEATGPESRLEEEEEEEGAQGKEGPGGISGSLSASPKQTVTISPFAVAGLAPPPPAGSPSEEGQSHYHHHSPYAATPGQAGASAMPKLVFTAPSLPALVLLHVPDDGVHHHPSGASPEQGVSAGLAAGFSGSGGSGEGMVGGSDMDALAGRMWALEERLARMRRRVDVAKTAARSASQRNCSNSSASGRVNGSGSRLDKSLSMELRSDGNGMGDSSSDAPAAAAVDIAIAPCTPSPLRRSGLGLVVALKGGLPLIQPCHQSGAAALKLGSLPLTQPYHHQSVTAVAAAPVSPLRRRASNCNSGIVNTVPAVSSAPFRAPCTSMKALQGRSSYGPL